MRKPMITVVHCAVLAVMVAGFVMTARSAEPAVSLDEIKQLREQAAQRTRRIVFDNDGNEPVYYAKEATPEALLAERTTPLAGSQVDTIVYCTWSSGFSYFTHNTKVGAVFDSTAEEPGKGPGSGFSKNKTRQFIEQGTDPLEVIVDWCRQHEVEVFWSFRMNDIHDAWGAWYSPHLFPPLKKEHPDWLVGAADNKPKNGAWTAVDYTRPEIRDLAFRFIEEVCTNYDVDGVQLDFFRHLNYFKKVSMGEPAGPGELEMMSSLLGRVRAMADDVGARRGKPILISVRVPDSLELCRAFGFDVERWMREDLIDIMTVSGYFRLNPWETSVELAHKYNVPVWPCLSESRIRDGAAAKTRASLECYRARAANVWNAGADAVYLFNFFNPNSPLWWELGDPKTLAPLDKVYPTATRGYGNLSFWYEGGERFMNRSFVTPDSPRKLEPGKTETVNLAVGENLTIGDPPVVVLRLRIDGLGSPNDVSVTLNGESLEAGSAEDTWLEYAVTPGQVNQGANTIGVTLGPDVEAGPVLQDLLLSLRHSPETP